MHVFFAVPAIMDRRLPQQSRFSRQNAAPWSASGSAGVENDAGRCYVKPTARILIFGRPSRLMLAGGISPESRI
jgi:hypothetical protein